VRVANQTANSFAFDTSGDLANTWSGAGEGETASPDDILNFWDLKPHNEQLPKNLSRKGFVPIRGSSHITGCKFF
jgi:hypothetical protein